MLKINGKSGEAAGMSIAEYLSRENFDARAVAAAARNGRDELSSQHRNVAAIFSANLYHSFLRR